MSVRGKFSAIMTLVLRTHPSAPACCSSATGLVVVVAAAAAAEVGTLTYAHGCMDKVYTNLDGRCEQGWAGSYVQPCHYCCSHAYNLAVDLVKGLCTAGQVSATRRRSC